MVNYIDFIRANSHYLSRADEAALSIHYDITLGCWVKFDEESTGEITGIMGKWYETGNQRSYVLYKDASNIITFSVSNDGATAVTITDSGISYAENQWFYVVGRYTPSKELALFVNGMWFKNSTSIPVDVFNSSEDFEIGRYNRDNYLDGGICHAFVSAYAIPNVFICSMYHHARALFMNKHLYANNCSSSTSSTSSSSSTTTSSSSTTTSSSSSTSSSTTTSSSSSSVIP